MPYQDRIVTDPKVLRGKPTVEDIYISAEMILNKLFVRLTQGKANSQIYERIVDSSFGEVHTAESRYRPLSILQ